ncbi:MAG: outer membrane lipoprotein-sorting protein [Proteobacteria bacterium]|nr:outer membrane lipoprotein-sorting protein [Pseudomonadota bacterium]
MHISALKHIVIVSLFFCVFLLRDASGASLEVFTSCYSPEELQQVKQWEQTWAGKKINKTTVDQVAAFLPESYVSIYKNPELWGAPQEGFYFYIVPYQRAAETAGMAAATKLYAPSVTLDEKGDIARYAGIAGRPFPQPKTGLEIAWNFDFNTHGDGCFYNRTGYNIVPADKNERVGDQDAWELFWIHRVDVDPRPAFGQNPKGISRSTFYHMYSPPDYKNTRMFNLRYIDFDKSDNAYLWFSAFRRIQRISNTERTDSIDGTDLIYDDEYFWDGQILRNTYSWKGYKELLCARHLDIAQTERQPGQTLLNNLSRERAKTLVVEVVSKDPNYIYSKRIWYVDPETYLVSWTELYDKQMRLWKCFENLTSDIKTKNGETKNFIVGTHFVDLQRRHAGTWKNSRIEVGIDIPQNMFTLYHLQKGGY